MARAGKLPPHHPTHPRPAAVGIAKARPRLCAPRRAEQASRAKPRRRTDSEDLGRPPREDLGRPVREDLGDQVREDLGKLYWHSLALKKEIKGATLPTASLALTFSSAN